MPFGLRRSRSKVAGTLDDRTVGVLEPGVDIEGRMIVTAGVTRLNNHFKGEIRSSSTIVVLERGEIEAEIYAKVVTISGKVKGTIQATERLEIRECGVVLGTIETPVLVVDPGGYLDGQCRMPTPEAEKQPAKPLV